MRVLLNKQVLMHILWYMKSLKKNHRSSPAMCGAMNESGAMCGSSYSQLPLSSAPSQIYFPEQLAEQLGH